MSGHKKATVNISQDEFDRLRRLDLDRNDPSDTRHIFEENLKNDYRVLISSNGENLSQRIIDFQNTIDKMDQQIREDGDNTNRSLIEFQNEILITLQDSNYHQSASEDYFLKQITKFTERLDQLEYSHLDTFSGDHQKIENIIQSINDKKMYANNYFNDAKGLIEFINENYDHEFFYPGKVDDLLQDLHISIENYLQGFYDAAVVGLQQIIKDINHLRFDLEKVQIEYLLKYQYCTSEISYCLSYLESIKEIFAIDCEGNPLPFQLDTNYWTEGQYLEIYRNLNRISTTYNDTQNITTLSDLDKFMSVDLPILKKRIEELPFIARISVINSQIRVNIADVMIQALSNQGYVVKNYGYFEGDLFNPYIVNMVNITGNEVTIDVFPSKDHPLNNEFHIITMDPEQYTQHELNRRALEIMNSLRSYGLEVGQLSVDNNSIQQPENDVIPRTSNNYLKLVKNDLRSSQAD